MKKFIFGVISGVAISCLCISLVEFRGVVSQVTYERPLSIEDFVNCNNSLHFDGITFLVSPDFNGYRVMISGNASDTQKRLVLDSIFSFFSRDRAQ